MRAPRLTQHSAARVDELRLAVHGLDAPFACGGSWVPAAPITLRFSDQTELPVTRAARAFDQERELAPLLARCTPAPFGHGRKTRYDRTVRHALQLNAEGGAFTVPDFDPQAAGILDQIRRELLPHDPAPLSAELYSLNIYGRNGHFVPHKDTPRGSDMIGTLVVCLPAQFANGALVLKHQGVVKTFDWAEAIRTQQDPTRLHWAAFFGDIDHWIEPVWFGVRVTLSYLLRHSAGSASLPVVAPADRLDRVRDALRAGLADRRFLPKGGTLAFPCAHLYHQDARFQRQPRPLSRRTAATLKGRDYLIAAAALAEGLSVTFCPYLIETCADQTWQLKRFPSTAAQQALGDRLDPYQLKKSLDILASSDTPDDFGLIWVDPPPHFNGPPTLYPGVSDGRPAAPDAELPAIAHLHGCEYSATGYFGNEGSETDFYVYGALHVAVPAVGDPPRDANESPARRRTAASAQQRRPSRKKT